jgi:hypothetical protein
MSVRCLSFRKDYNAERVVDSVSPSLLDAIASSSVSRRMVWFRYLRSKGDCLASLAAYATSVAIISLMGACVDFDAALTAFAGLGNLRLLDLSLCQGRWRSPPQAPPPSLLGLDVGSVWWSDGDSFKRFFQFLMAAPWPAGFDCFIPMTSIVRDPGRSAVFDAFAAAKRGSPPSRWTQSWLMIARSTYR